MLFKMAASPPVKKHPNLSHETGVAVINRSATNFKSGVELGDDELYETKRSLFDKASSNVLTVISQRRSSFDCDVEHNNEQRISYAEGLCCQELFIGKFNELVDPCILPTRRPIFDVGTLSNEDEVVMSHNSFHKGCEPKLLESSDIKCAKDVAANHRRVKNEKMNDAKVKRRKRRRFRYGFSTRKMSIKTFNESAAVLEQSSFCRPNFIKTVVMGSFEMDTWYWSPYPNEFVSCGSVYICEKCLELKKSKQTLDSHMQKQSEEKHNLSCIVTLPCHQEKGFGRFLIDFSFLLTRKENMLGSAEKPLSELGLFAYRSYWRTAILEFLYLKKEREGTFCALSVDEIARGTGIQHEDVVHTLSDLEMLSVDNESVMFNINLTALCAHWDKAKSDPRRIWIDEKNLKWRPKVHDMEAILV